MAKILTVLIFVTILALIAFFSWKIICVVIRYIEAGAEKTIKELNNDLNKRIDEEKRGE